MRGCFAVLRQRELNIYKEDFKWATHCVPPTHVQSLCSQGPWLEGKTSSAPRAGGGGTPPEPPAAASKDKGVDL